MLIGFVDTNLRFVFWDGSEHAVAEMPDTSPVAGLKGAAIFEWEPGKISFTYTATPPTGAPMTNTSTAVMVN